MHISSVFVTHDQEEALEVADRVVVMNRGRIEQIGSPDEVYSSPASPFVYQFLGNVNVFRSRLHGCWAEVEREGEAGEAGSIAFVRPHDIELDLAPMPGGMKGTVTHVHRIGPLVRVELEHEAETIEVELTRERAANLDLSPGRCVWFRPRQGKVFSGDALAAPAAPAAKQPFLF
jgi:sulfate transport system ATP-binding protein